MFAYDTTFTRRERSLHYGTVYRRNTRGSLVRNFDEGMQIRLQILISKGIGRELCANPRAVVTTTHGIFLLEIGGLPQA